MSGNSGSVPQYNANADYASQEKTAALNQQFGNYGVNYGDGMGGLSWTGTGANRTMNVDYSDADKTRQNIIQSALGGMSLDPAQATQDYYNNALAMLGPQIEKNYSGTRDSLVNMGYNPGSSGYSSAMGDAEKGRQLAYNDLATNAMTNGQNFLGAQIGNIGSLQGQITTPLAGYQPTNPGLQSNYGNVYNSQLAQYQQNAANQNSLYSTLGSLAGAGIGGYAGYLGSQSIANALKG
jgi:hypothetical protein